MAYILKGDRIFKVKIKSEDVELDSIRFYDNYYHIPYLTLFFDFKTNILIQNEIFEVEGFFTKDFDFNMDETEDELNLRINMDALPEKAIDNIFTIMESYNRPILRYDYNTCDYTAELTNDLLDYLKNSIIRILVNLKELIRKKFLFLMRV